MTELIDFFGTGSEDWQYRWLSNFHWHDGRTIEHDYQAAKTDDKQWQNLILQASTPNEAKKLGQKCPMRPTWDDDKLWVMDRLLHKKFRPGTECAELLRDTGSAELVEGNWWRDTYWGVYKFVDRTRSLRPEPWPGENHLGQLIMGIRAELNER